ncbi:hypothetical protein SPHINGO8BC_90026 [Sphingobacterium multivorum]|uniref:Uncharacterized protein n=1 Tax=Sphingobacterium multivorum TaxID=28454 RepID=A0A654DQ33_SPHMU|nr:hypothetical protein SPHINGO8BC_90026 [Sphingobacterium multivorum]
MMKITFHKNFILVFKIQLHSSSHAPQLLSFNCFENYFEKHQTLENLCSKLFASNP